MKTLNLKPNLLTALTAENINDLNETQKKFIPEMLAGKDVILQSSTGSGKTLAYLLPIFERCEQAEPITEVVIVVPTQELAMQVHRQVESLSKNSGINLVSLPIFANVNIKTQIEKLKSRPQIIVGTTSRILNLIQMKKLPAHTIKTLIIDEADRSCDKSSFENLKALRKSMMKRTQVICVSASFPAGSREKAESLAQDPVFISIEGKEQVPANITHQFITCDKRDKMEKLRQYLAAAKPENAIIFINELGNINIAVEKLQFHKVNCAAIHSASTKLERQKNLADFRTGKLQYLVATDVAARGLHIDGITNIISVSVAQDPIDYLHRAGRTGRNGKNGISISIISPAEANLIAKYEKRLKVKFQEVEVARGKVWQVKSENKTTPQKPKSTYQGKKIRD